jgi:hypothetical protein
MEGDEEDLDMVMYLECAAIDDGQAALMISFVSALEAYELVLPDWEALLDGISVDGGAITGDEQADDIDAEDQSESAGNEYLNDDLGFGVTWDEEIWSGAEIDDSSGVGVEFETELSYGLISATEADVDVDECPLTFASELEDSQAYKRVRKAPSSMERPETDDATSAELYTMLDKSSPTKLVIYFECRELPDPGYLLTIRLMGISTDYDEMLPQWQSLIDGVSVDSAPSNEREVDDSANADDEEGNDAIDTIYRSTNFYYYVKYDPETWTVNDTSDEELDNVWFDSEIGQASIVAVVSDYDLPSCVDALVENEQQYAIGDIEIAAKSYERPEPGKGAEGELYAYTMDAESGPADVVIYFECRSIGDDTVLGFTFYTATELYDVALPYLQELINGIKVE